MDITTRLTSAFAPCATGLPVCHDMTVKMAPVGLAPLQDITNSSMRYLLSACATKSKLVNNKWNVEDVMYAAVSSHRQCMHAHLRKKSCSAMNSGSPTRPSESESKERNSASYAGLSML